MNILGKIYNFSTFTNKLNLNRNPMNILDISNLTAYEEKEKEETQL